MNKDKQPPDKQHREKRRAENSKKNEFVIKSCLKKIVCLVDNKELFINEIQDRVEYISKLAQRLSLSINIFIRNFLKDKDLTTCNLPDVLNTTFAYQIINDFSKSKKPIIEVRNFLTEFEGQYPEIPDGDFQGDRNSKSNMCQMYITNYKTFLTTTFKQNQKRFVMSWGESNGIPKKETWMLRYKINNWGFPVGITQPEWYSNPSKKLIDLIDHHQTILKINQDSFVCESWIKNNYLSVIVYYYMLSIFFKEKQEKQILIAPVVKSGAKFLYIDTSVLYGILKQLEIVTCNEETFKSLRNEQWESVFNVKRNLTTEQRKTNEFTGTIQTDGISVCIHYRRPKIKDNDKLVEKKKEFNASCLDPNTTRVIGNDPGRTILFYGAEKISDNSYKYYKLSKKRFRHESGINIANKYVNKWTKNIQLYLDELSLYTYKDITLETFLGYSNSVMINYDELWSEYLKKRWRRQRLNLYSEKKKTYDKFFNSLYDSSGKKLYIAYGDAGFASTAKYELSSPTTRILKECKKKHKIVKIDEFRTSIVHARTDTKLIKVKRDNKIIRGLLWCSSTKKCEFVGRDKNAAENMERLFWLDKRPEIMRRSTKKTDDQAAIHISQLIIPRLENQQKTSGTALNW